MNIRDTLNYSVDTEVDVDADAVPQRPTARITTRITSRLTTRIISRSAPGAAVAVMRRVAPLACLVALIAMLGACNDLLDVDNPGLIQEGQLADSSLRQLIVNGAVGEFQNAYALYAQWSGILADETISDHTNAGNTQFSHHDFDELNSIDGQVYVALQRARQSSDDAVERLAGTLGDAAGSNVDVARVLAYGGYSYVLLGEGFCEAPVNMSAGLPSDELLRRAIAHFDSAITVATAALGGADSTGARDVIEMSNVGAARAALWLGDAARARSYAEQVSESYEKVAYYSDNSVDENNPLKNATGNPGGSMGLAPRFLDLDDPRVPQLAESQLGLDAHPIFPPQRPMMFSEWSATDKQPIAIDTDIAFASGLEARYILAEIDGPTSATSAFVDARRAVGGEAPSGLTGDALMAELREQRARDLFLTGHRLGDLRRYEAEGIHLFPTGTYPTGVGVYGDRKCFIVPLSEKSGNPNY